MCPHSVQPSFCIGSAMQKLLIRSRAAFGFPAAGQGELGNRALPVAAASQAPWSAKTASRSRHRSSGVTQCGWAIVPLVIASSAVASRRVGGEAADPAYRIPHASLTASSISGSVTPITRNRPSRPLDIRNHTMEPVQRSVMIIPRKPVSGFRMTSMQGRGTAG
jgi:hypothetical protein